MIMKFMFTNETGKWVKIRISEIVTSRIPTWWNHFREKGAKMNFTTKIDLLETFSDRNLFLQVLHNFKNGFSIIVFN